VRYIGIDIGREKHAIAIVGTEGEPLLKPQTFEDGAEGYKKLADWLGDSDGAVVGLEATGHYWKNLVAWLIARGFGVVVINPLRTRRFAEADLIRAKTDAVDALAIARFLSEKRPKPSTLPAETTAELRELIRLHERLTQDLGDRTRQLHRALDLGFPEFRKLIPKIASSKATALLTRFPTAKAFAEAEPAEVAAIAYRPKAVVGAKLASELIALAKRSVGAHHGDPYQRQVRYFCEDIELLRRRLAELDDEIENAVDKDELATLLTTIDGIGPNSAARLIATFSDFSTFPSSKALAAFIGVAPIMNHSGKRTPQRAPTGPLGASKLRHKLYMPTLRAIRSNPLIKAFYDRLVERGKPKKLAIIACMRKLLELIYAVATKRQPFDRNRLLLA
jgi:transposase